MIERLLAKLNAIPADKVAHFAVGAILAGFLYMLCYLLRTPHPLDGAAAGVFTAAWSKEFYDYLHRDNHTPDPFDALATFLGGVVVLLPIFLTR